MSTDSTDPDAMLLLAEVTGKLLVKTFTATPGGVETRPYDNGFLFRARPHRVDSIDALAAVLGSMSLRSDVAVVRGALAPGADPDQMRRLKYRGGDTAGTLVPCMRRWLLLDYDGQRRDGWPDLAGDPEAAVEAVLEQAPPEIRSATMVWQLGNSAGVKPLKYSLHLWLLLDRPVDDASARAYLAAAGFDPAMADSIQLHYVGAPRFVGVHDPVDRRIGVRRGAVERVDASPIIAAGQAAVEAAKQKRARIIEHVHGGARRATVAGLMAGPLAHLVTEAGKGGWINCNCPNHTSESKASLHINIDTGQWRCNGCATSGGSAWSLANFISKGDTTEAARLLRAAWLECVL